jgi:hypothetical protein
MNSCCPARSTNHRVADHLVPKLRGRRGHAEENLFWEREITKIAQNKKPLAADRCGGWGFRAKNLVDKMMSSNSSN